MTEISFFRCFRRAGIEFVSALRAVLPAASYENVVVTIGAKTTLNVDLKAGGAVGVVDVSGEGQGVELTRTSISSTVDETKVINLPTNGRNFLDFATLAPGVVRDPTRAGVILRSAVRREPLTAFRSTARRAITPFLANLPDASALAAAPSEFSVDTVKEFQVNTNGFSAEYGRAAGGVINAITKSGTNCFSGSAYEYFRDESLDAAEPESRGYKQASSGRPDQPVWRHLWRSVEEE